MKTKYFKYYMVAFAFFGILYLGYRDYQSKKLDAFYLDQLKTVKSRMIYGSSVDTQQELSAYQDHIELCMHLDGYNGPQIMKLRAKALKQAALEKHK